MLYKELTVYVSMHESYTVFNSVINIITPKFEYVSFLFMYVSIKYFS